MNLVSMDKIAKGVAWASIANWGCQLLAFVLYTGLARLLTTHAFGLVAIASVYIAFMQVFVTQGFGMAIIQRRELNGEHLDSAFWIAMATAASFCILSILLARPIAHMYKEPSVAPIIGWLSLSFVFYAMCSVPTAILTREMDFRALAIRGLMATGVGGTVGLAMAFFGCGVWSLVVQQLVGAALSCVCLWWAVSWRPRLQVSKQHLRDLYKFSLNITGNDILWFFSQKSDQTVVGYAFGPMALGPYSLASRISTLVYEGIVGPSQSVAFPALAKLQCEPLAFARAIYKFCEISSFVSLPVFAGMAVVAPELVPVLFGIKWTSAVGILQVLAFYGAVRVLLCFVHPLMLAKGRAGLYLVTNVMLSCLTFVGCLVAVRWGPQAVAISIGVTMSLAAVVFVVVGERYLEISAYFLLKSFAFPVLSSLLMFATVGVLRGFLGKTLPVVATLAVCVVAGMVVYTALAVLLRPDLVKTILGMTTSLYKGRVASPALALAEE